MTNLCDHGREVGTCPFSWCTTNRPAPPTAKEEKKAEEPTPVVTAKKAKKAKKRSRR